MHPPSPRAPVLQSPQAPRSKQHTHKNKNSGEAGKIAVFMVSIVNLGSADLQANTLRHCTGFGQTKTAILMESKRPIFVLLQGKIINPSEWHIIHAMLQKQLKYVFLEVKAQQYIKWYI